jgi:hypothetical protein
VLAVLLAAVIGRGSVAFGADNSDSPESLVEADWLGVRQVLVIPQQCSREAVSTLCDRGEGENDDFAAIPATRADAGASARAKANRDRLDYGTLADYERQRTGGDFVPAAPGYVTIPPAIAVAPKKNSVAARRATAPAALAPRPHP